MNKEKKLSLEEIKVESFTTVLDGKELEEILGGSQAAPGTTSVRIFC